MKLFKRTNPYRIIIQLLVLALIVIAFIRSFTSATYIPDYEAYCPYGGMLALSGFLLNSTLACSMTAVQIAMGVALVAMIIVFSKLFCSFICPVGTISELIGKAGEKMRLRFTVTGSADIMLRGIKYALLFVTFYFTLTSSELFCRKFDPYYASLTGFGGDVSFYPALIVLALVIAGSFFIRLFWCKYICPLGAVSNIFRFLITFAVVTGIYLLLVSAGLKISFIWPLALICVIAYILEFYSLSSRTFPLFTVRRNTEICTDCKLCTKHCPQNIDVASELKVKHIDCNLCGDCLHVCPEEGALTINRKGKKWLPAAAVIAVAILGFIAGKTFEIPTISQYWGDPNQRAQMSEYVRTGLKSVKCFGSSTAFANQMKKVNGVTGVTTFVSSHTVRILYSPQVTDTLEIVKAIFSPVRVLLVKPQSITAGIREYTVLIENFFDSYDAAWLQQLLLKDKGIYGFTTRFGCPVIVNVYADAGSTLTGPELKSIIESKILEVELTNGKTQVIHPGFRVRTAEESGSLLSVEDFNKIMPVQKLN